MMELTIVAFAQAREALGFASRTISCSPEDTPRRILGWLQPGMEVEHLAVALDGEYSSWDGAVGQAAELAIIPPVSGG